MLSKDEAVSFITEKLGIDSPLSRLSQDARQFVGELISAFLVKIPFQSISLIATPPENRHR